MRPIRGFSLQDEKRRLRKERLQKKHEREEKDRLKYDPGQRDCSDFVQRLTRGFRMIGDE